MYGNFSGRGTQCLSAQMYHASIARSKQEMEDNIDAQIRLQQKTVEETEAMIRRILKDNPNAQINININV